jgi:hypothetical protein
MAEPSPEAGGLESASADLRANAGDLDLLLHRLVEKLQGIPGFDPVVTYRQGRLRRILGDIPYVNDLYSTSRPISAIRVGAGGDEYLLEAKHSAISCRIERRRPTGSVTPSDVSFSSWIAQLIAAVESQSRAANEALAALENLIVYDRPE